jgi:hypothetical protein
MTQVKITTGVFGSPIQTSYTLDDLEKDDEFQETAERFLESIGEKSNDVFEYLRDSDFNLVSGMQRAMQSGKFNEQQKQDYSYLRSKFDNADMGSLRQYLELIKDASVDIVTDPTLITAALTAPITGGTSFAARQGVATAGLKTAKAVASNKLKDVGQKQIAKATAITGAEIGAWTGLDNHFRQNTELNVGLRQMYSKPELVGSTALGTLTGGLFGNLAQRNALFNSRMNRLYSNDEYRADAGNELLFKARKAKDAIKAVTIGKPTSILKTIAEYSPTARKLGQTFTEDFERRLTERTTKRLGYSYAEDLDSRRSKYLFLFDIALKPIRKTGKVTSDDEIGVIRILRGDDASAYRPEVQEAATNLRKMYDTILKDAEDVGLEPHRIENYFSRSWNKKAILDNEPEFKKMLVEDGVVPADEVNDVVRGMLNKNNELYSSHSNLLGQARSFKNLNDNKYEKFLTNDLIPVATNYFMNAARAIEHKKTFLLPTKAEKLAGKTDETVLKGFQQSNEDQFVERYITKIDNELAAARNGKGLSRRDKQKIVKLYKSVTGQVDYFDSGLIQGIYDTTKLANAVAYLPLATISSFTEAFIPLAKAPTKSYVKGVYDGITKGHKIFTDETVNVIRQKHGLSDDAIRREMASVWIGIDEAMADVTNRLAGEGLQNEILQKGARGFYRFNLLVPWTKTVQLAAFSTGKDLIQSNLNKLNKLSKEGIEVMSDFAPVKAQNLKSELFDLGVDVDQGLKWLNAGAKLDDEFYEQIVRGAGRFTNEVILQTSRERAKVPLYMTNPKFDILTQFLRYPTVFSNTILKNFARNTITNPAVNAPRLTAFAMMATNVALATNYWRSSKEERDRINEEGLDNKDILRAFQRIGLLGPLEHGYRYSESLSYGQNPLVGLINLGGPAINDIVGMTLYDRGLLETAARKAPLIGTRNVLKNYTGLDPYTPLKEKAKEKDDEINAFIEDIARKISMNAEEESGRTKSQLEPMTRSTLNTGGFVTATGNFQSTSETEQEIDKITGDVIFNFFKEREKRRDEAHQEIIKASKEGDVRKGFEAFETLPIGEQLAGYMNPITNVPLSATGAGVYAEKAQPSFKSPKEFILDAINPRKNILQKMPIKVEDPLSAGIAVAEATGLIPVAGFFGKGTSRFLRNVQARRGDDTMGGGGSGKPPIDKEQEYLKLSEKYYKDSEGVFYSPVLKTLLLKAPENVKGEALLKWLNNQEGIKKEELNFLKLDEYVKENPKAGAMDMAKYSDDKKLEINTNVRVEYAKDKSYPVTFIEENSPEEGIKIIRPKNIPFISKDEAYAYGNDEIGYDIFMYGENITQRTAGDFGRGRKPLNKAEAEIQLQGILKDEGILDTGNYNQIEYKQYIDRDLPGGKNYEEITFNLNENVVKDKIDFDKYPSSSFHFKSKQDETQFAHALIRDRKVRVGNSVEVKNSLHIDELQSDVHTLGYDIGYKNPIKDKIELEKITEETKEFNKNIDKLIEKTKKDVVSFKKENPEILNDSQFYDFENIIKKNIDEIEELPRVQSSEPTRNVAPLTKINRIYNALSEAEYDVVTNKVEKLKAKGKITDNTTIEEVDKLLNITRNKGATANIDFEKDGLSHHYKYDDVPQEYWDLSKKNQELLERKKLIDKKIPDYPYKNNWHEPVLKQLLYKAAKENKDALSVSTSDVILTRYSGEGPEYKKMLYDKRVPSAMKKLANKYGGIFERKGMLEPSDINPRYDEYLEKRATGKPLSSTGINFLDAIDIGDMDANIIFITPEMREKILKEGVPGFAKGGLVEGKDDVPYTKENPADRVDPFTGQPYSAQMEELGLDVFQER